jgi:predicted nucleic acid-binding protein
MDLQPTLVDTGALVALVNQSDEWHEWAVRAFRSMVPPLLTCEAVLSETWHLLRRAPHLRTAVARMHEAGLIRVEFAFEPEAEVVRKLLLKYANLPMDFADACLVRMAELIPDSEVWTIDEDFYVYRRHGRQPIPLIIPTRN